MIYTKGIFPTQSQSLFPLLVHALYKFHNRFVVPSFLYISSFAYRVCTETKYPAIQLSKYAVKNVKLSHRLTAEIKHNVIVRGTTKHKLVNKNYDDEVP